MSNEIVINASAGETRVGIIERNLFTELHIERSAERNVAGTVVKGRVTRVLPGMQAEEGKLLGAAKWCEAALGLSLSPPNYS